MINSLLLILTPTLPVLMAASAMLPQLKPVILRTAWLAPVPALMAVALVPDGAGVMLQDVLFGLGLGMTPTGRIVLGFSALLWLLAAVHAMAYLAPASPRPRFTGLFLFVMAGNLGLIVAQDLSGFYTFFAMMSLASYVLVVHDQTDRSWRAGAVYIVLAVIGETALLVGLLAGAVLAGSTDIAALRAALGTDGPHTGIVILLAVGFGIKMGLFPLHVWLPLAHPAAPAPASAVLSGAMIKAGLFGMITFLPIGLAAWPTGGAWLVVIGLFTAFYGVVCGLVQSEPKAVLAYSSLSQMGVMAAGLGAAWVIPEMWPAMLVALAAYMLHHGLTKGGLFLLVGAVQKGARKGTVTTGARLAVSALAILAAIAVAGFPMTSGAVAKLALKGAAETVSAQWIDTLLLALSLSAVATTVLVARFLWVFAPWRRGLTDTPPGTGVHRGAGLTMIATAGLAILAGQAAIWIVAPSSATVTAMSAYGGWQAFWPFAAGIAICATAIAVRATGLRLPTLQIPQGDILYLVLPWGAAALRSTIDLGERWSHRVRRLNAGLERSALGAIYGAASRQRSLERSGDRKMGQQTLMAVSIALVAAFLLGFLLLG